MEVIILFALNIDPQTHRILSATFPQYAGADATIVDYLPEGDISNYLYINGGYIFSPINTGIVDK